MIADWDVNHLFVSDRLEDQFPHLFPSIRCALPGVTINVIPGTYDIWSRDYMPLQIAEHRFCQFVYRPDYLRGYEHVITPHDKCRLPGMEQYIQEPIVLDGGNVVASRTRVILTDKVFSENPTIKRNCTRQRLEQVFDSECIFIPTQAGDEVGHSDGVVRFLSEHRVLINDYSTIDPRYGETVRNILERYGLQVDTLPMFEEHLQRRKGELPSAVGIYINYLRVGDLVVVPGYDRPEDEFALEKLRHVLPDASVLQVPCRDLAQAGGVLNCISWTVRM